MPPAADDRAAEQPLRVVLPTFERPAGLRRVLMSLDRLPVPIADVYVVDNGPRQEGRGICSDVARATSVPVRYLPSPDNVGPAGATSSVMSLLMEAGETGWLLRLDDDRPVDPEEFLALWSFANATVAQDPSVAVVGLEGARWSPASARLRPPRRSAGEPTDVDYLKTGMWPLFRLDAARVVGPFRADFFFGMTEVEYGLRLRRAGFRLVEATHLRGEHRVDGSRARPSVTATADWRRYYSLRNLLLILLDHGRPVVAVRVALVRGLLKPLFMLLTRRAGAWLQLRLSARAIADAAAGRTGRRVDPAEWGVRTATGDRPHT